MNITTEQIEPTHLDAASIALMMFEDDEDKKIKPLTKPLTKLVRRAILGGCDGDMDAFYRAEQICKILKKHKNNLYYHLLALTALKYNYHTHRDPQMLLNIAGLNDVDLKELLSE